MANTKYLNQVKLTTTFTPNNSAIIASDDGQTVAQKTQGQINAITPPSLPLSMANGGTNANLTANNGGIFYSTGSAGAILNGTVTANQVLLSGSSTTPAWSTATYPSSTTINRILYSSNNNIISEITTVNSAVLVTSAGGVPSLGTTLPAVEAGSCTCTDPTTASSASINTALSNVYAAAAGFASIVVQTFTSNGTYTPTSGMKYCTIECWGAGGGGGGATYGASQNSSGGGGGAGGYSRKTVNAATIGASKAVTIGTLGAGGAAGANTGTAGTATSVSTICVANGGAGGIGAAAPGSGDGGAGGTAGTGDIAAIGMNGFKGGVGASGLFGAGASTILGSGGAPGNTSNGASGSGYGTGGGGANTQNSASKAGGNGTKGYVIITEYV